MAHAALLFCRQCPLSALWNSGPRGLCAGAQLAMASDEQQEALRSAFAMFDLDASGAIAAEDASQPCFRVRSDCSAASRS